MNTPPLLNTYALKVSFIAAMVNLMLLFFLVGRAPLLNPLTTPDLGYSIYKHGVVGINRARIAESRKGLENDKHSRYYAINLNNLHPESNTLFPSISPASHGFLIALIWWLTGSMELYSLQIIQVLLFIFFMLLVYQVGFLLFKSEHIAYYCSLFHLAFLPLLYLNLQITNDIWAYYSIITFMYGYLRFFRGTSGYSLLFILSSCAALFQHMRPTVLSQIVTLCLILLFAGMLSYIPFRKAVLGVALIALSNVIFFWIPFTTFNKKYYGRYFVGPTGQGLLEGGLGECPNNPWGFEASDGWFAQYMLDNYGLKYGTPECDDKAKEVFWEKVQEHPGVYFRSVFRRFLQSCKPHLIKDFVPDYFTPLWSKWSVLKGVGQKIRNLPLLFNFKSMFSFMSIFVVENLYFLIFYLGCLLALTRKKYFELLIIIGGVMAPCLWSIFSHIEYRYLIPFYWPVPLFVGYFVWHAKEYYLQHGLSLNVKLIRNSLDN